MASTVYETRTFTAAKQQVVDQANVICQEYADAGIPLTLRQLYYQFVARGLLENRQTEYKRLGDICRDARMAGEMDWDHLIDLTRDLRPVTSWKSPQDLLSKSSGYYHRDLWAPQRTRIEVWIEKDAAIGVVQGVCRDNSVPYFSCRGYTSMSEMHDAAQRIRHWIECGDRVQILHIGDHDPSGLDMSRDVTDRLRKFINQDWVGLHHRSVNAHRHDGRITLGTIARSQRETMREHGTDIADHEQPWSLKRIALNQDQIERYNPPPNPAKQTDARFQRYVEETGLDESWELDALAPDVMADLIQNEINLLRDDSLWASAEQEMEHERQVLESIGTNYEAVAEFVAGLGTDQTEEQ